MCEPTTIMLAISAASAVTSYVSANQNAEAQAKASNDATALSYEQNTVRQGQINDQSALDKSERVKQGMLERAKMATIAGESGALGLSSDRLLADSFMQEGTDIASLEKNRQNNQVQTGYANRQAEATGKSEINKAEANKGNLLQTGLQIGGEYVRYDMNSTKSAKNKASV